MTIIAQAREYAEALGYSPTDDEYRTVVRERIQELEQRHLEEEERQRQHELELRRLERVETHSTTAKSKMPPPASFDPNLERMDEFLQRFSTHTNIMEYTEMESVILLYDLLTPKDRRLVDTLPHNDRYNLQEIKALLMDSHKITPAKLRSIYYNLRPEEGDNMSRFVRRLEQAFDSWLRGCGVEYTVEALRDFLLVDQTHSILPPHVSTQLRDRGCNTIEELGRLGDQFLQARPHTSLLQLCKKRNPTNENNINPSPAKTSQSSTEPNQRTTTTTQAQTVTPSSPRTSNRNTAFRQNNQRNTSIQLHCDHHGNNQSHSTNECRILNRSRNYTDANPIRNISQRATPSTSVNNIEIAEENSESQELPPLTCNHAALKGDLLLGKLKTCRGVINSRPVEVLLDGGANAVFVRKDLIPKEALLNQRLTVHTADTSSSTAQLAKIHLSCPYYCGDITVVAMEKLTHDVLLGRVPGTSSFEEDPDIIEDRQEVELSNVTTRSASKTENGSSTVNFDPLSIQHHDPDQFKQLQRECSTLQSLFNKADNETELNAKNGSLVLFIRQDGTLFRKTIHNGQETLQLVAPKCLRMKILEIAHDNPLSGHYSQKKTKARIERDFYWPNLVKDVQQYCHSCHTCQLHAPSRPPKAPIAPSTTMVTPFTALSVDLVGPLQPSSARGNKFILTVVDQATRYADAIPLRHIDSETVAQALLEICTRIGFPRTLTSDNGTQFTSATFDAFLRLMGIKHRLTPPYHAQSNGIVERFNGTLKVMLRKLAEEQPRDWDLRIPTLLFAYRDAPQSSTGFSPFELIYGHRVRGPLTILKEYWASNSPVTEEDSNTQQYLEEMKHRLQETCKIARENLTKSQETSAKYFNKRVRMRTLKVGDKVLIFLPDSTKKLLMSWKGPYEIKSRLGQYTYSIDINGRNKTYHINLLRKYHEKTTIDDESPPPDLQTELPDEDNTVEEAFAAVGLAVEPTNDEELDHREPTIPSPSNESISDCKISPNLTAKQKEELQSLLLEFESTFTDVPGRTTTLKHHIQLRNPDNTKLQHSYPLPFSLEPQLKLNLQEWLRLNIISPSLSPHCSPLLAVRKNDGTHRFCLDCRHLNNQTEFDAEPIADINAIFAHLSNKSIFTKIDLTSGYWQVPLSESSRKYTAFRTRSGLYEFQVMPFGLANAPATFSRLIRMVTADIENIHVYMDDILIATSTWEEHLNTLQLLLKSLSNHGLRAKPSKCEFGFDNLQYLGHQLGHNKLQPTSGRVEAIESAPLPKNKQQLRSFLGAVGYYQQFIPHYADKAAPLHDLLKKNAPEQLQWTDTTTDVFDSLKTSLTTKPILQLPDSNAPFILRTDASQLGLGAVLLQPSKKDFRLYSPVFYASRRLRGPEVNYSTIEKEALAIYWALQKFEIYLYGREFVIETDHRPLLYLQQADKLNPRLKRWSLYFSLFKFKAIHINGTDNHLADALSRLH